VSTAAVQVLDPQADLAGFGIDLRLWLVDLDAYVAEVVPGELDHEELQRAARFARAADRCNYLASHAALRRLLGTHGRWVQGRHGKPALTAPPPHFNLSRRDGVALIGMSMTHELGVDVETLHPVHDAQALADLHFTSRERADVASLRGVARERAFLLGWTRKEACLKATGCGLSLPPSTFECGVHAVPARVPVVEPQRERTLLVQSPDCGDAQIVVSWAVVLE
jgi:4'-phosphopantetheinyl transferase